MQFGWVERLLEQVPTGWTPELVETQPNERVLGPVPEGLMPLFVAAMWATDESERIKKEHSALCTGSPDACQEAAFKSERLRSRAASLGVAFFQECLDHFQILTPGDIVVRKEGAAFCPKQTFQQFAEEVLKGFGLTMADIL